MGQLQEIDALMRFVFTAARLNSLQLREAPPAIARPVILWETPFRPPALNVGRAAYRNEVQQYGKLYAHNLAQLLQLQDKLNTYLENQQRLLPVYETDTAGAPQVGWLKSVTLEWTQSTTLDAPFILRYTATQSRVMPEPAPPAETVHNRQVELEE